MQTLHIHCFKEGTDFSGIRKPKTPPVLLPPKLFNTRIILRMATATVFIIYDGILIVLIS